MLGEKIKFIRNKLNLNQREFAKQLGISKSAISNYELNLTDPPFSIIATMVKLYNLDIQMFICNKTFNIYKNNIESLNTQVGKKLIEIHIALFNYTHRLSFNIQGIPEDITKYINEIKVILNDFKVLKDTLLNAINNYELLKKIEILCNDLEKFICTYKKIENDLYKLLNVIEKKINHVNNLYNQKIIKNY